MSHEIRTPLNGVLGMAQAMAVDALSPASASGWSVIRQSGEALLAILNDVLDLSKIEAGKLELEEASLRHRASWLAGAHAAFTAIADKKGLDFDLRSSRPPAASTSGDSDARAADPLQPGLQRPEVHRRRQRPASASPAIDGAGARVRSATPASASRPSAARTVREVRAGRRLDDPPLRRHGPWPGHLPELTELMGGAIDVESELGRGHDLHRHPAAARSRRRAPAGRPPPARPAAGDAGRVRVLAAEDNAINQLVLKTAAAPGRRRAGDRRERRRPSRPGSARTGT